MNINDIKELMLTIDKTSIQNVEIENNKFKIKVSKNTIVVNTESKELITTKEESESIAPSPKQVQVEDVTIEDDENTYIVKSPIVGAFYGSPSPDAPAFISVGDKVDINQTLCIIEAMKIMNEIQSEVSGEVVEILVDNEDIVEYGQPLMKIRR